MGIDHEQVGGLSGGGAGMVKNRFDRLHRRLAEKAKDASARAVTYVAFGDSVTQGCMASGVIEYDQVYPIVLTRGLREQYPGTIVNAINSGVGGDTAVNSRARWERDLFRYQPDLVTLMFGHNDVHAGIAGLSAFIDTMDELVRRIRAETEAEVLVITPCMMMKRANPRIAAVHERLIPDFVRLAEQKVLEQYVEALRSWTKERDVLCFDAYRMWEDMERQGVDIHDHLSNGINHPTPAFHVRLGEALAAYAAGRE